MMLISKMHKDELIKLKTITERQLLQAQKRLELSRDNEMLIEDITEFEDTLVEIELQLKGI